MKRAILNYKEAIANMIPSMETADPDAVWRSVKDKVGLCICPPSQVNEKTLECMIPDQEVPQAAEVLGKIEEGNKVMQEERELIRELFDSLETAHSELASACSSLSHLSGTLKPRQLMTILEASTRPLIQIKTTSAFKLPDVPDKMSELPDDPEERVELLMMPNPMANTLKDERVNSPTRLLAATWAYRISNIFGKGTTQRKFQELYSVQVKQLVACIMGRKYLGGADRKRRLSETDEGPSSSKKPVTSLTPTQ